MISYFQFKYYSANRELSFGVSAGFANSLCISPTDGIKPLDYKRLIIVLDTLLCLSFLINQVNNTPKLYVKKLADL